MEINLNNPEELTLDNVKALIASKDDSRHRQLRIRKDGVAFLSDEYGQTNIDGLACRFETWCAGNGYCGIEASQKAHWVKEVFQDLQDNWPNPKDTYIDY